MTSADYARRSGELARRLYSLAWCGLLPLAFGYLLWRGIRQPAYRAHWAERLGLAGAPPAGLVPPPLVWIHAVSVGETRAAMPLLEALAARDPQQGFLLTHATPTGRETGAELAKRLPGRIVQCYLPYDLPGAVARFLDRWRPACGLLIETEVWPNLAAVCARRQLPLALVNGRLSARSLARGQRQARLIVPALRRLSAIVVQTADDAARLEVLGRPADAVCGNLKYDITPSPGLIAQGRQWRRRFGERPVVLAASTREGEEDLLIAAWRDRLAAGPLTPVTADRRPLLIVVPRHPQRFEAVADRLVAGFGAAALARRADLDGARPALAGDTVAPALASDASEPALVGVDVLLGDSMGEMPAWYAAADVAIIGGSLLPFGAQNLIEANAVGCPVVLGPSTFNFAQAAEASVQAGAAVQVADADRAVAAALDIAGDRSTRERMATAAVHFTTAHRGATQRTLLAIDGLLPPGLAATGHERIRASDGPVPTGPAS